MTAPVCTRSALTCYSEGGTLVGTSTASSEPVICLNPRCVTSHGGFSPETRPRLPLPSVRSLMKPLASSLNVASSLRKSQEMLLKSSLSSAAAGCGFSATQEPLQPVRDYTLSLTALSWNTLLPPISLTIAIRQKSSLGSSAPHAARSEWEIVGELAVQIKDNTSSAGALRVYKIMLRDCSRRSVKGRSGVLQFLARTLRSADPSPQITRALTRDVLQFFLSGDPDSSVYSLPLAWLLGSCQASRDIVDEEISAVVAAMTASDGTAIRMNGLRLAVLLEVALWGSWSGRGPDLARDDRMRAFWIKRSAENATKYADVIIAAASDYPQMRYVALFNDLITTKRALEMRGALLPLLQSQSMNIFDLNYGPYLISRVFGLATGWDEPSDAPKAISDLEDVGRYLRRHPQLPWIAGKAYEWFHFHWNESANENTRPPHLSPLAYLGGAAILLISAECYKAYPSRVLGGDPSRFGTFAELYYYIECRLGIEAVRPLRDLPVPDEFKQVFRDWAEKRVNFTTPL